jgi:RNA polymerase sigma factor (sigma-70 family)
MPEMDDIELLAQYARNHSEAAFAALVERHVNLVHSVALRNVGNPHAAEEITQAVFIILARKANKLPRHAVLSGWLYQTTRLTAANFLRGEIRRQKREQEAYMQSTLNESESEAWRQIAPILDDAISKLGECDRNAILLRFFENRNLRDVGLALGASEDAAKMRVNRALEKLRKFFRNRGVTLSGALIAGAVSAHSVQAAPAVLAKSITAVAITQGVAASGSTLTLIKTTLKLMAWTKMKTAVVTGAVIILVAGTTATLVIQRQPHLPEPHPVSPAETDFPKGSWVFAGFADPQSALVSGLWAQIKTDSRTFLTCLSPEARQKQQQGFRDRMKKTGKSENEVYAEAAQRMDKTLGFQILGQEVVSENQVLLHLYIQGNEIKIDAKMVKVGNEWKLDDFINEKRLTPNEQH